MLSLRTTLKIVICSVLNLDFAIYMLYVHSTSMFYCVACGHGIKAMTCCSMNRATGSRRGPSIALRSFGPAASPVWSRSRRPLSAGRSCPATVPSKTRRCVLWRRAKVLPQRSRIPVWTATPQSLVKVGQHKLPWYFNSDGDTCTLKG